MFFELPPLPYEMNALAPYMSEETLEYHYGKHHKAYIDNLNNLIKGTKFEKMTLEEIVVSSANQPEYAGIFNNAAQAWNHNLFWKTMTPNGGGKPKGELLAKIEKDFGSYDKFREQFKTAALGQFGSGWAWLVDKDGKLSVMKTANGDNPLTHGATAIIGLDVWEHAYYIDYRNARGTYVDSYLDHLVKWD
ncbi:MAG: superoxide dismutase [Alphaproteobacteria bacterium]|nr:superoxide dismutase [Alphaproteobacteria bacterium]